MEIVIYEQPELSDTLFDNESIDEHKRLMEELGINPDSVNQPTKSPCPYPIMDKVTREMFKILLPEKYVLSKYNRAPIPLKVLQRCKHAVDEEYFDKIYIRTSSEMPDPIVYGFRYNSDHDRVKEYTWNGKEYLIARWGDVLRPFTELWELARKVLYQNRKMSLESSIAHDKHQLEQLHCHVHQELGAVPPFDLPYTKITPGSEVEDGNRE